MVMNSALQTLRDVHKSIQKGGVQMAVINTPINGRVRFTYPDNLPDLRINGINPAASAAQIADLAGGIQSLQTAAVVDGFLTVESELSDV